MPAEFPAHLLLLDRAPASQPLQQQLFEVMRKLIQEGALTPDLALPSTRQLAAQISVSRNTVSWAYERLAVEGYISTRHGTHARINPPEPASQLRETGRKPAPPPATRGGMHPHPRRTVGSRLAENNTEESRSPKTSRGWKAAPCTELASGAVLYHPHMMRQVSPLVGFWPFIPDVREFPFKTWQRLAARRMQGRSPGLFGYSHLGGFRPLREIISEYLRVNRGLRCSWQQVVITNGGQAALDLAFRMILSPGDTVWFEDPGYTGALAAVEATGAHSIPLEVLPTDAWVLEPPPGRRLSAIYLTPSCQQPFCRVMPIEQRREVIRIAREHDAWIVEDDFDNDFRPPHLYVPAIQSLEDEGRTFYAGTFTKTLFPGMRLGYLVAPESFVGHVEEAMFVSGHVGSVPVQSVLYDFLEQGHYAKHINRTRRLYAERKRLLEELIDLELSDWISPIAGEIGLQITTLLKGPAKDVALSRQAATVNLGLQPLSINYHFDKVRHGFLLGYATLNEQEMRLNIGILRSLLATST